MDSSPPAVPNPAAAPSPAKSSNRLALCSFLLALLPFLMAALIILANARFPDLMNHEVAPGIPLILVVGTGEYLGSHLVFLGALIGGSLGLSRAGRDSREHTGRGFAIAALALAIVGLLALICLDVVVAYIRSACQNYNSC